MLVRTRRDLNCKPNGQTGDCLQTVERYAWDGQQQLAELRAVVVDTVLTNAGRQCLPDEDVNVCTPQDSSFVWTQTGAGTQLESDATVGPYAGTVRYTFASDIDDPLALWKNDGSVTFGIVPHRSWRGLYEAGSWIGPYQVNTTWPGRTRDAFFANDIRLTPIPTTQWLGGLVDGKRDQSGLMYMRNRYYDPNSGRFTQEDPSGLAGGANLYGFAGADPVNRTDPFGLLDCTKEDLTDCWAVKITVSKGTPPAAVSATIDGTELKAEGPHAGIETTYALTWDGWKPETPVVSVTIGNVSLKADGIDASLGASCSTDKARVCGIDHAFKVGGVNSDGVYGVKVGSFNFKLNVHDAGVMAGATISGISDFSSWAWSRITSGQQLFSLPSKVDFGGKQ